MTNYKLIQFSNQSLNNRSRAVWIPHVHVRVQAKDRTHLAVSGKNVQVGPHEICTGIVLCFCWYIEYQQNLVCKSTFEVKYA